MTIEGIVMFVLFVLGVAAIFGVLFAIVVYCEKEFPQVPFLFRFLRIFLVVAAGFMVIFLILDFMGHPIIHFRSH